MKNLSFSYSDFSKPVCPTQLICFFLKAFCVSKNYFWSCALLPFILSIAVGDVGFVFCSFFWKKCDVCKLWFLLCLKLVLFIDLKFSFDILVISKLELCSWDSAFAIVFSIAIWFENCYLNRLWTGKFTGILFDCFFGGGLLLWMCIFLTKFFSFILSFYLFLNAS